MLVASERSRQVLFLVFFCKYQEVRKGRTVSLSWKPLELSVCSAAPWDHFAVDNYLITRFLARCVHPYEY